MAQGKTLQLRNIKKGCYIIDSRLEAGKRVKSADNKTIYERQVNGSLKRIN